MSLDLIITTAGRAALINAANTGTSPVTISQVGLSQAANVPSPANTVLAGEFARMSTIGGIAVADDTIHVSFSDDSAAAYTLKSFALYLSDGTLFAIYGQPTAILTKTAESTAMLALDVVLADINTAEISFGAPNFTDPDATTSRKGLVELATVAEAQAGIDALRALTPAGAKAAMLGWLLGLDGSGSGLDADLLDGQHGSWYSDIAARLGFTPVNKAGDSLTGQLTVPTGIGNHGAIRVCANPTTGNAIVQFLNAAGDTQWGFLSSIASGALLWRNATVWTGSNDGSGSGLDADLLDGQDSSFYTNIIARLGFTPLNAANYSAADILAKLATVDGSGSGIDADQLDGYHASAFAQLGSNVTFGMVDALTPNAGTTGGIRLRTNAATGIGYMQITDASVGAQYGFWRFNSAGEAGWYGGEPSEAKSLKVNGNVVWNTGNDGSGSGLDADMVDGRHASEFLPTLTENANGKCFQIGGFKIQFGQVRAPLSSGNVATVTFPVPFTTAPLTVLHAVVDSASYNQTHLASYSRTATTASFKAINDDSGSGSVAGFDWVAFGI